MIGDAVGMSYDGFMAQYGRGRTSGGVTDLSSKYRAKLTGLARALETALKSLKKSGLLTGPVSNIFYDADMIAYGIDVMI